MDPRYAGAVLAELLRNDRRAIVATIARRTGSLDIAEEAVDRAIEAALELWPRTGIPESSRAWIFRTASHKAVDALRHRTMAERAHDDLARVSDPPPAMGEEDIFPDDQLRLIFTCCHPAIAPDAQVALALRLLCGLKTEEVARAFTVPEATMAQRLVRAKAKIRAAKIPYEVPSAGDLGERLETVLAVIYGIFNEAYVATGGDSLGRHDLAREATRLAELVVELLPEEDGPKALLALILLIDARRDARVSSDGALALLEDQDRTRWDGAKIERGTRLLDELLARAAAFGRPVHALAIEAAIQALHDRAPRHEDTDFRQIVALYGLLRARADSPLVELAEAAAIAMAQGLPAGLARVREIKRAGTLESHHLLWSTEGEILRRLGKNDDARRAFQKALSRATNGVEKAYLVRRLAMVGGKA